METVAVLKATRNSNQPAKLRFVNTPKRRPAGPKRKLIKKTLTAERERERESVASNRPEFV